jgi:hypothetical protein
VAQGEGQDQTLVLQKEKESVLQILAVTPWALYLIKNFLNFFKLFVVTFFLYRKIICFLPF